MSSKKILKKVLTDRALIEEQFNKVFEEGPLYSSQELTIISGHKLVEEGLTIKNLKSLGIQASMVARAAELWQSLHKEGYHITMSITSNIVSSGLREIILELIRLKLIDSLIATTGAFEEDIIKEKFDYHLIDFKIESKKLPVGHSRIGNMLVSNKGYIYFYKLIEKWFKESSFLTKESLWQFFKKTLKDSKTIFNIALENRVYYRIPYILDGSLGDCLYFLSEIRDKRPLIDDFKDHRDFLRYLRQFKKKAVIFIGGGLSKHYNANSHLLTGGADAAIYITSATYKDASDSGGDAEEAKSWNKIDLNSRTIELFGEATIVLGLIFLLLKEENKNNAPRIQQAKE